MCELVCMTCWGMGFGAKYWVRFPAPRPAVLLHPLVPQFLPLQDVTFFLGGWGVVLSKEVRAPEALRTMSGAGPSSQHFIALITVTIIMVRITAVIPLLPHRGRPGAPRSGLVAPSRTRAAQWSALEDRSVQRSWGFSTRVLILICMFYSLFSGLSVEH